MSSSNQSNIQPTKEQIEKAEKDIKNGIREDGIQNNNIFSSPNLTFDQNLPKNKNISETMYTPNNFFKITLIFLAAFSYLIIYNKRRENLLKLSNLYV